MIRHIRHNLRELPSGKKHRNEAIISDLKTNNYSLLEDRCKTVSSANAYRKKIEKECFKYNRKNLVHAVEITLQLPEDCPEEQKEDFFRESYNYICSTLPMGERCVFVAEVHADERHYTPTGEMISKEHLHLMYVPAVKDTKHIDFEYKLCADQLTKKNTLKKFHPALQKYLTEKGIQATVYKKKEGSGKAISLTVSQLKEITEKTGLTVNRNMTATDLAKIINANILNKKEVAYLKKELKAKEDLVTKVSLENKTLKEKIKALEKEVNTEKTWGKTESWGENTWGIERKSIWEKER